MSSGPDVIHTPIPANDVREGWVLAYVDQLGNKQTLGPHGFRASTDKLGQYPTIIYHSGLVDRFDDTTYYTT